MGSQLPVFLLRRVPLGQRLRFLVLAGEIIEDSYTQNILQKVECKCKKISGNTYHLYENVERNVQYLSMVGPSEWTEQFKDIHFGSYYYDFDKTFVKLE